MERIIIHNQRNKFKGIGFSINKAKKILWEKKKLYNSWGIPELLDGLELDHIIPYSICADSSIENLQLLTKKDHKIKSGKERKIINEFKRKGWIEKTFTYLELNKPIEFLIKEFKKRYKE